MQHHPLTPSKSSTCNSLKQHFNFIRNDSSKIQNILTWNFSSTDESNTLDQDNRRGNSQKFQEDHLRPEDSQKRNVSFDMKRNLRNDETAIDREDSQKIRNNSVNFKNDNKINNNTTKSSISRSNKKPRDTSDDQIMERIRQKQVEAQERNKQIRTEKVKKYINDLIPFTRTLTNTKYQEYFQRAALESYGRANTNEPIGGIIYGNHQKSFNINPHTHTNQPKTYQTHTTAINFAKRTKLSDEQKWIRLQKELTKKLGLKDKNQTLKEGKEVIYVDVNQNNMETIMKENLEFKKKHFQEIREKQKAYEKQREREDELKKAEFNANKAQKIMNALLERGDNYVNPRDVGQRMHEQVIYRQTDENGIVRYGADRHALTCFVDMNFPQNDAAYTEDLKSRLPIFPIEVAEKDKHIDNIRRDNYQLSLTNKYPSHYLVPNSQQPQIIQMLRKKYGNDTPDMHTMAKTNQNLGSTIGSAS